MFVFFRQKIEELEAERQQLEEQNNTLEMRLERHNLQVILTFCARFLEPKTCLQYEFNNINSNNMKINSKKNPQLTSLLVNWISALWPSLLIGISESRLRLVGCCLTVCLCCLTASLLIN